MFIMERCVGGSLDGKMPPRWVNTIREGFKWDLALPTSELYDPNVPCNQMEARAYYEMYYSHRYFRYGPGWEHQYKYWRISTMSEVEALERITAMHREKYPHEFDD